MLISFPAELIDNARILKGSLSSLCSEALNSTNDANVKQDVDEIKSKLEKLDSRLADQSCKLEIVVAGQFNSGKSTFINALFGSQLALTSELEMTYAASFITYGDRSKNIIHYGDNTRDELSLEELLAKLLDEKKNLDFKKKIKHIEISSDNPSLDDVNIWDSPGFGSTTSENELVAEKIVKEADVLLWVFDIGLLGDQNEVRYIRSLRAKNFKIIGIFNKIDSEDIPLDSLNEVKDEIENIYGDIFEEVFFVSSVNKMTNIHKVSDYLREHHIKRKYESTKISRCNQLLNFITSLRDSSVHLLSYINYSNNNILEYKCEIGRLKEDIDNKVVEFIENYKSCLFADEATQAINELQYLPAKEISDQQIKKTISNYVNKDTIKKSFKEFCDLTNDFMRDTWKDDVLILNEEYSFQFRRYESNGVIDLTNDIHGRNNVWDFVNEHFPEEVEKSTFFGLFGGAAWGALMASPIIDTALTGGLITLFSGMVVKELRGKKKDETLGRATIKLNESLEKLTHNLSHEVMTLALSLNGKTCAGLLDKFYDENAVFSDSKKHVIITESLKGAVRLSSGIAGDLKDEIRKLENVKNLKKYEDFIIYAGDPKKGTDKIIDLLTKSRSYVYIVDPYFSEKSIDYLKFIPEETSVRVLLANIDNDMYEYREFVKCVKKINSSRESAISFLIAKRKYNNTTPLHDRYLFSEDWAVKMGNSFDAIGRKDFGVSFISENEKEEFQDNFFQKYWENRDPNVHTHPILLN